MPSRRAAWFLVAWLVLGPLPGGITEPQNVGRCIGWLPAPQILAGLGFGVAVNAAREAARAGRFVRAQAMRALVVALVMALTATAVETAHTFFTTYPLVTEPLWQSHIRGALDCARRRWRADPSARVVISPAFRLFSESDDHPDRPRVRVFAQFLLKDVAVDGHPAWVVEPRTTVGAGELYATPASVPPPRGEVVCVVHPRSGGAPISYVYGRGS